MSTAVPSNNSSFDDVVVTDDRTGPKSIVEPLAYRRFALVLLIIAFMLNFVDRQIVNILAEVIKRDLKLADWQIGMMSGLAFALLYTMAGIPIARLADRGDRPRIMSVSVILWSGFTIACSLARSFPQLLLGRIGVGLGEAGLTPAATSLIVEQTPHERRASALSLYYLGLPLGTLAGMAVGGLVADAHGWRTAFIVAGAPGLLMAPLLMILREPRRAMRQRANSPNIGLGAALASVWRVRTFRLVVLGSAVQGVVGYGFAPFLASFFLRNHATEISMLATQMGLKPQGFLGLALGLSTGLAGAAGVWLGGVLADRLGRRDLRLYVTIPSIAAMAVFPCYLIVFSVDSGLLALLILALPNILGAMWMGPVHSTQQSVTPPHLRSSATALFLLILNLIGVGVGPLAVGLVSDLIGSRFGYSPGESLRSALILVSCLAPLSAWLFWSARSSIDIEYER